MKNHMKIILYIALAKLAGCNNDNTPTSTLSSGATSTSTSTSTPTITAITFSNTLAPTDQYAQGDPYATYNMSVPYTTSVATVTLSDGTSTNYPLEHKMLFRSDDVIPTGAHAGEYYGGIVDTYGTPVLDPVAANNPHYTTVTNKALTAGLTPANKDQFVADTPDGSALIQVAGAPSSATTADLSYLTHFEYVTWDGNQASQYGKNPMFVGNSLLSQDLTTGLLTMKSFDKVTFNAEKGLWIPCAASKSPWNTFIGSEEYEADQYNFDMYSMNPVANPLDFSNGNLYQAFRSKFGATTARPYDYGYVTETTVDQAGVATAVKHYATGRLARELIKVMPDGKTYYSGDDSKSTILFMGIADVANDLSATTLYASKFTQTSPVSPANTAPGEVGAVVGAELGAGTLSWIRLGHATDAQVKAWVTAGTKSTDIFDIVIEPVAGVLPTAVTGIVGTGIGGVVTAADMTAAGYKRVFNYYHRHTKGKAEWLRLRPNMAQAAAFLETRRYAVYLGATSEWTKMEGVAMNAADKKAYIAISYQYDSMTDGVGDIQMGLLTSGNTYELSLAANVADSTGAAISSAWVATSLAAIPELKGLDNAYAAAPAAHERTADAQGNFCATSNVGNPDNLKFSESYRTLFVGEDSNCHVNNFVWAFNVDTRSLSRILSVPMGAEATGLMTVDNINGYAYIGANYQHPGDNGVGAPPAALVTAVEAANPNFAAERNRSGGIGYIHFKGMPRM